LEDAPAGFAFQRFNNRYAATFLERRGQGDHTMRFKFQDIGPNGIGRMMRTTDRSEEEFEETLHGENEEETDPIEQLASESRARREAAAVDKQGALGEKPDEESFEPLTPIEQFQRASNRKWGRMSTAHPVGQAPDEESRTTWPKYQETVRACHLPNSGKPADVRTTDTKRSPVERFIASSRARWARS
jgi:hypothetical protein